MDSASVIRRCRDIVDEAGIASDVIANPLDFFDVVRDIIKEWPKKRIENTPEMKDFVTGLRMLRDDFEAEVRADPLILYKPAHKVSLEFHQSSARIRYFRGGNRISKTQSGTADNYWVVTGKHPYRAKPPIPSSVAIIGVNFSKYAPAVFETKYLVGENGNPLSPVFPEGGKYFNRYDAKKHILYIACPDCVAAKKPKQCKHAKGSIILFSDLEGPSVLQGGQYAQIQFDESIQYEFLGEALKRIETVPNSGMIVTETPLMGKGWWTNTILARDAAAGKTIAETNQPLVSLHTIDQFSAGLTPKHLIEADMQLMSPSEIEARVYGRPAAFNEHGVFDPFELSNMAEDVAEPERGEMFFELELETAGDKRKDSIDLLYNLPKAGKILFQKVDVGAHRIWVHPEPGAQYIIGGDVAQGLTARDASAASVLKMTITGFNIHFDMVAQFHGWRNPRVYAEDLVKLALYYNEAIIAIERNGPGNEAIRSMVEWGYWNLFRDISDPAQTEFSMDGFYGINTDRNSKPMMVSILQQTIKDRKTGRRMIKIRCKDTLDELGSFGQKRSPTGRTMQFEALSGMADDRVMSLMVPIYAAKIFGLYDYNKAKKAAEEEANAGVDPVTRDEWKSIRRQLEAPPNDY
jgi:hypothetical protein